MFDWLVGPSYKHGDYESFKHKRVW